MQFKIYLAVFSIFLLTITACSTQLTDVPNKHSLVSIDLPKKDTSYRLYVNFKDTNTTLVEGKNRLFVPAGKVNLQVVNKYKTAWIDFDAKSGERYFFRILQDNDKNLIFIQTPLK